MVNEMLSLAPDDEEAAKDEVAIKLGIDRELIQRVRMVNWITGEVLVQLLGGLRYTWLDGASPA